MVVVVMFFPRDHDSASAANALVIPVYCLRQKNHCHEHKIIYFLVRKRDYWACYYWNFKSLSLLCAVFKNAFII